MFGMFDDLFDFNHDGELDSFERAAAVTSMAYILDEIESEDRDEYEEDDQDSFDFDF